jgi:hypothetical protein
MRLKMMLAAVAAVATLMALGGTAFAGEITGGGKNGPKPTPVATYENPNSICAFSGQNDDPTEESPEDPFASGRVQSFGDIVQQYVREFSEEPGDHVPLIQENKPGINCNKNRAPDHEG